MRDQQSSDTSIALDANTDVQQEADKPAVKWRYLFGFLAWTVLNAIAFYMTVSIMIPQRLKDIGVANPDATLGAINATCAGQAIGSFVTSSIVTMTHNYNLVFPTAIVIALCAGASVLTIKRIK